MTVVVWVCGLLVAAGAAMAIVRAERGPSMLDRTVALDVLVTTLVAGLALFAAVHRRADVVPVLVVLSLVGFVGSVAIARFAAVEPSDARSTGGTPGAEGESRAAGGLATRDDGAPTSHDDGPRAADR